MNPAQLAPHDDAPGPLLTSGRDADVYALDEVRVLRRNRDGQSVLREAAVVRHVWAHGFPVPEVFRAEGADIESGGVVDGPELVADRHDPGAVRCEETRGVGDVHCGPAVPAVTGVARDAPVAGDPTQGGDEPVVTRAVRRRREPQRHRPHAAAGEVQQQILGAAARCVRSVERRRVVLGGWASSGQTGDARRQEEGAVGADQLIYQEVADMEAAIIEGTDIQSLEMSCFNGDYVTGTVSSEYLDWVEANQHS